MVSRFSAILCLAAAVLFGFFAQQKFSHLGPAEELSAADPLSRLLGTAKEAIGDTLFIKADEYFHGGLAHEHHHDETEGDLRREGVLTDQEHEEGEREPADWVGKINYRLQPHEITHLTQEKRKEMLPFFAMATALDPHNTEAILTAAYWLDREFDRSPHAVSLLEKGIRDNPDSWEMENALARIFFRDKARMADAERHFREAVRKSEKAALENYQRVELGYHWAESLSLLGDKAAALSAYELAARSFDSQTTPYLQSVVLRRIKELHGSE